LICVISCGKVLIIKFGKEDHMFADERKSLILQILSRNGNVRITDLSQEFNVSTETIRRDLNELSDEKKLAKVHGGAIALKHPIREDNYVTRVKQNCEAKKRIGEYAAGLICDGEIIFLDYGATTEEIAKSIFNRKNLTVIINSFNIAGILKSKYQNGDFTGKILFIGGNIDCDNNKTRGEIVLNAISRFSADKAFIGATSISEEGIMMWDESDGEYSAVLCKKAARTYIVADSSKFEKDSFYKFLDFSDVNHIITDDENAISDPMKAIFTSSNVELHIVKNGYKVFQKGV
jgi:DeoR/GlpR family transcriptional regulator of sugar metabolism